MSGRRGSALPEGPQLALLLIGAGALFVSGGALVAMHLLLRPGRQRGRGKDEDDAVDYAAIEAYDLSKPVEEELALVLSDEEEEEKEQQPPPSSATAAAHAGADGRAAGKPSSEAVHPDGKKLSRRARSRRRRKASIVGPHIETFPQQERGKMMVKIGLLRKADSAEAANKCNVCWITKRHCICAKLPRLTLPVDFAVLLHYKEYLRISNTGHLLPLMHKYDPATNTGSELLIKGLEESDARLAALEAQAAAEPYSVIALMPSDDAITLHDLVRRRKEAGTSEGRLKVILLDGTWRQGRALNRRLSPHVTRVKLQVLDRPSLFRLRRRTRADGICTIEAAALTVVELGEECGERYDGVIEALNLLNTSVLESTNKPPKDDQNLFGAKFGKGGKMTTRRAPLPPLRQQVAGGGNDDSFLLYEDAQSSVGEDEQGEGQGDGEDEEEDDDLVVFESPDKGLALSAAFEDSRERASSPEAE